MTLTVPSIHRPARIATLGELRAVTAGMPDDTPVFSYEVDIEGYPLGFETYIEPDGIDPDGDCGTPDTRPALILSERAR